MKSFRPHPLIFFSLLFISLLFGYINFPAASLTFDEKLRELLFDYRGEIKTSQQVVIVDIDEKSIDAIGQWPFSRDNMAQVLINLTNANAGIIGLDVIFSEEDRSSPLLMAKKLNLEGDFQDTDQILGQVIANTPTILGYYFSNQDKDKNKVAPNIKTDFKPHDISSVLSMKGVVSNISKIQTSAYSSGFFNAFNNQYGKLTKMPLLLKYQNKIYPSLSLEMIRIANQSQSINVIENNQGLVGLNLNTVSIPTDKKGFMRINYRGAKNSFKYLSFIDVLRGDFNSKDIQNKFVLIGTSSITLADLRSTVFDLAMPGVEVHANVIDNILSGDFLYENDFTLAIDSFMIFLLTCVLGLILLRLNVYMLIPFIITLFTGLIVLNYLLLFKEGMVLNLFYPFVSFLSTTLIALIIKYMHEQKSKSIIKNKFSKKVSEQVVNELLNNEEEHFKSSKKEVSIFFSDIRSFTKLSEKIDDPERLISLLNTYMEPMVDEIIKQEGTIDKFIGDAIMAYWNAPQVVSNHEQKAVQTAINQINALELLNTSLKQKFDTTLSIGIGIHVGTVTVGEMGSSGRSDYTIIGDNVNLASRIEGLTKYFEVSILITQNIYEKLDDTFFTKKLCDVIVQGKENSITIYEVLTQKQNIEQTYYDAIKLYEQEQFTEAKVLFETLQKLTPCKINVLYIQECIKYENNPTNSFNKAFKLSHK